MARLVLFALLVLIAALAVMATLAAANFLSARAQRREASRQVVVKEDTMPQTIRTIAYAALLLLLTGIVTGVIGGG